MTDVQESSAVCPGSLIASARPQSALRTDTAIAPDLPVMLGSVASQLRILLRSYWTASALNYNTLTLALPNPLRRGNRLRLEQIRPELLNGSRAKKRGRNGNARASIILVPESINAWRCRPRSSTSRQKWCLVFAGTICSSGTQCNSTPGAPVSNQIQPSGFTTLGTGFSRNPRAPT